MGTEAVVLTGGASRRMGENKAAILVDGIPLAAMIINRLLEAGLPTTVIGREPIEGAEFIQDAEAFAGPLMALAAFSPTRDFVFVASCDLPLFDARMIAFLRQKIGDANAAVPLVSGRQQPLCALYRSESFQLLADLVRQGERRVMAWLNLLSKIEVDEANLQAAGIDPLCPRGVNTPEELARALALRQTPLVEFREVGPTGL